MYFKERRACLLLEHGVVRSAFLQRVPGQCECLEASWWSHGDTRGLSTMCYSWSGRAREGLERISAAFILGSGAIEMVPCIPTSP